MSSKRPESRASSDGGSDGSNKGLLVEDDDEEQVPQTEAQQDTVKLRFDKDISDMIAMLEGLAKLKSNSTSSKGDAAVEDDESTWKLFIDARIKQWCDTKKTTSDNRNFLHFLACDTTKLTRGIPRSRFIAMVISRQELLEADAMCKKDSSFRTPLAVALLGDNINFISAACLGVRSHKAKEFAQNLRSEGLGSGTAADSFETTCLHSALRKLTTKISSNSSNSSKWVKSIIKMIEFMPTEMFRIADFSGHTPLHLAVEYDRGRAEPELHEQIISKLLERVHDLQETALLRQHNFYQIHEKTRRNAEGMAVQKSSRLTTKDTAAGQTGGKVPEIRNDIIPELKKSDKNRPPQDNPRPLVESNTGQRRRADSVSVAGENVSNTRGMALDEEPLTTLVQGDKAMAPPTDSKRQGNAASSQKSDGEERRKTNADKTGELLKLAYLRLMKPQEATAVLHVPGKKDKELWYDFGPKPTPQKQMTIKEFKAHFNLFKHLEFDQLLQYVAFPKLEIILEQDSDVRYCGSNHMGWFFIDWLQNEARVKRILKVEVDDMPSESTPSHSDDAIGRSLEPFGVETLDWRKPDLCPLLISRIGKCLRDITLQWSGSNAVLRAWSEPEGLPLTPSLRHIHIVHKQGLESKENTIDRLEQFRERLKNSWTTVHSKSNKRGQTTCIVPVPSVDVVDDGHSHTRGRQGTQSTTASPSADSRTHEQHIDPHRWMACSTPGHFMKLSAASKLTGNVQVTNFASAFLQIKGIHDKPINNALHPVTVALIDDGVDIGHTELQVRLGHKGEVRSFPGKSFDTFQRGSRISPYWLSRSGHGTLMARLIHKIAPSAVIYVIKLKTEETASSTKIQIEAKSAIQAIQHAIELGVQVISMSWTTRSPNNTTDVDAFDRAIQDAHKKGILMFCSASDRGDFEEFTYPHGASGGEVFRIGAASKDGAIPTFVGKGDDINFILPGEDVTLEDNDAQGAPSKQFNGFASHTGSSVATALAAGLAAMVIECVRLAAIHTTDGKKTTREADGIGLSDVTEIRKKRTMEEALYSIGSNNRSKNNKYIEVWKTFAIPADRIRSRGGTTSDELDDIVGLAKLLLRKGAK